MSGLGEEPLRQVSNSSHKVTLRLRVVHAITVMCVGEFHFEIAVLPGDVRVLDEVVVKQEPIPVHELGLDHMDMVRPDPVSVTLDEPRVVGRRIRSRRSPKIVVPLRFEDRWNSLAGFEKDCNFDQNIYDGLGGKPRYGRTSKILDSRNQVGRQAR